MATFRQCAGRELNPHALRHMALNHACLPIPAPARKIFNLRYYSPQRLLLQLLVLIPIRKFVSPVIKYFLSCSIIDI